MGLKEAFVDTAKMPMTLSLNIGSFALDVLGRGDQLVKLIEEEPRSRAITALKVARRAIGKGDNELARFEVQRAAKAVQHMEPEAINELGPQVVTAALELPGDPLDLKIIENAAETIYMQIVTIPDMELEAYVIAE